MKSLPELSVVVIARNEARHIARAIESVLQAVENYPQTEILLVDSASTDDTVAIASQYPINIVRLHSSWFLSASAGRYVGMHRTSGDLILYLDGDMELITDWLDRAARFMMEHPELAGVTGLRCDMQADDEQINGEDIQNPVLGGQPVQVKSFGGCALYRRAALEQVGGFNPFLISNEEPELCMRLRYAGYKLMRIPYLMCKNYTVPLNSWEYIVRRFRTNLWLGYGQVLRYHLSTGMFWMVISEQGSFVVYLVGVLLLIISLLLTLLFGNSLFFGAWLLVAGAFFLAVWAKKRSIRKTWLSILLRGSIAYGAVRGFLMAPRPAEGYPTNVEVVQMQYDGRGSECLPAAAN